MACAKMCDRCGAFFKPYNNKEGEYNGVRKIRTAKDSSRIDGESTMKYELCPECMNKLMAFLYIEKFKETKDETNT